MLVKPLKFASGKFNFKPNSPEFEVSDADAKALIADGAVRSLEPEKPKKEESPKQEHKSSAKKA